MPAEVTSEYVLGLRHENQYLENMPDRYTVQSQAEYISGIIDSNYDTICGLFMGEKLIGTAGIQEIGKSQVVPMGIFLFDPGIRGKGFGKVLVWSAAYLSRQVASILAIYGSMRSDNVASRKAFEASGGRSEFNDLKETYTVTIQIGDLRIPANVEDIHISDFATGLKTS